MYGGFYMDIRDPKYKQLVYDLLVGTLDLERYPITGSELVENLYADGSYCDKLYSDAYNAKLRITERFGVEEDKDTEIIFSRLTEIAQYMSMKMYDYGVFFSERAHTGKSLLMDPPAASSQG